jgi:hypothetical protein
MQVYTFSTKNRIVALLATLVILGAGAALLLLGLALLAGVAVVGGVLGTGLVAYRMLRGDKRAPLPHASAGTGLDPSLEVFADQRAIPDQSTPGPNDDRRIGSA